MADACITASSMIFHWTRRLEKELSPSLMSGGRTMVMIIETARGVEILKMVSKRGENFCDAILFSPCNIIKRGMNCPAYSSRLATLWWASFSFLLCVIMNIYGLAIYLRIPCRICLHRLGRENAIVLLNIVEKYTVLPLSTLQVIALNVNWFWWKVKFFILVIFIHMFIFDKGYQAHSFNFVSLLSTCRVLHKSR